MKSFSFHEVNNDISMTIEESRGFMSRKYISINVTIGSLKFYENACYVYSMSVNAGRNRTVKFRSNRFHYASLSAFDSISQIYFRSNAIARSTYSSLRAAIFSILSLPVRVAKPTSTNFLARDAFEASGSSYEATCQLIETTLRRGSNSLSRQLFQRRKKRSFSRWILYAQKFVPVIDRTSISINKRVMTNRVILIFKIKNWSWKQV